MPLSDTSVRHQGPAARLPCQVRRAIIVLLEIVVRSGPSTRTASTGTYWNEKPRLPNTRLYNPFEIPHQVTEQSTLSQGINGLINSSSASSTAVKGRITA